MDTYLRKATYLSPSRIVAFEQAVYIGIRRTKSTTTLRRERLFFPIFPFSGEIPSAVANEPIAKFLLELILDLRSTEQNVRYY